MYKSDLYQSRRNPISFQSWHKPPPSPVNVRFISLQEAAVATNNNNQSTSNSEDMSTADYNFAPSSASNSTSGPHNVEAAAHGTNSAAGGLQPSLWLHLAAAAAAAGSHHH